MKVPDYSYWEIDEGYDKPVFKNCTGLLLKDEPVEAKMAGSRLRIFHGQKHLLLPAFTCFIYHFLA